MDSDPKMPMTVPPNTLTLTLTPKRYPLSLPVTPTLMTPVMNSDPKIPMTVETLSSCLLAHPHH